jgi:hypothetical protein
MDARPAGVVDWDRMQVRLLRSQCSTCVFRPGNKMQLAAGRLADLVRSALADEGFIVCHQTLPYGGHEGVLQAVCRGFADRYSTQQLQLAERLGGGLGSGKGFLIVDPPEEAPDERPAQRPPDRPRSRRPAHPLRLRGRRGE